MSKYNDKYLNDGTECLSSLIIEFIGGSRDVSTIYKLLNNSLIGLNRDLTLDTNPLRYQILLENNYDEMLAYTFEICHRHRRIALLQSILTLFITITNSSDEFNLRIAMSNIPELLITDTVKLATSRNANYQTVYLNLSIVFNIVRKTECREYFWQLEQINKFKDALQSILYFKIKNLKVTSMLVLAILMKDTDKGIQEFIYKDDIVGNVFIYASKASKRKERKYKGFSLWELMLGLENLSTTRLIRIKMLKTKDFINTMIRIVSESASNTKEVTQGLDILRNLSADSTIRKMLLMNFKLDSVVELLSKSSVSDVQRSASELLNELRKDSPSELSPQPSFSDKFDWKSNNNARQFNRTRSLRSLLGGRQHSTSSVSRLPLSTENVYDEVNQYDIPSETYWPTSSESRYITWSSDRVTRWLLDNRLSEIRTKLVGFDGEMLGTIKSMKINSPTIYYKKLETSLKLSFLEILRLDRALEKLE